MYQPASIFRAVSFHALVILAVMTVSTPEAMTPLSSYRKRRRSCYSFLGALAPIPNYVCGIFLLSVRCATAILAASIRLIVPPWKKSLLGEIVLVRP
jgi:hypothetical protein